MRILLLALLATAFSSSLSAQTLPITYTKGFLGPDFRYDNLVVMGNNFRNAMSQDPEALAVLSGSGGMEFGAALLAGFGTVFILEGLIDTDDTQGRLFNDSGTAIGVGLATLGAGFGLQVLTNRKRIRAIDVYNQNLGFGEPLGSEVNLRLGLTRNGPGLSLTF